MRAVRHGPVVGGLGGRGEQRRHLRGVAHLGQVDRLARREGGPFRIARGHDRRKRHVRHVPERVDAPRRPIHRRLRCRCVPSSVTLYDLTMQCISRDCCS